MTENIFLHTNKLTKVSIINVVFNTTAVTITQIMGIITNDILINFRKEV